LVAQEQVLEDQVLSWTHDGSQDGEQQPEEFDHAPSIADLLSRGLLPPHNF